MNNDRRSTADDIFQFVDVCKSYGAVRALHRLNLTVRAGEIHGLLGDNGAGKSTLMKIASGATRPDSGQLLLNGETLDLRTPGDAREAGIEMVYQDLALAEDRSAAANLFIGRELLRPGLLGRVGILDRERMKAQAERVFEELSIPLKNPSRSVNLMSGGQRQGVAIARAAIWARHVLLLDEPTAALGVPQRKAVFELAARLRDRGLGILMISHDVPEMLELSDRVTVLRLGRKVATRPTDSIDANWVVSAMVGGETFEEVE